MILLSVSVPYFSQLQWAQPSLQSIHSPLSLLQTRQGFHLLKEWDFAHWGLILGGTCVIAYMYWYCKKLRANPEFSYTYDDRQAFYDLYMKDIEPNATVEFTFRRKLILILFSGAFPLMVWGVMFGGWWFPQMAASFLAITIIIMFISGLPEKDVVNGFTHGASELVGGRLDYRTRSSSLISF